jgi:hypothetical protein
MTVPGAGLVYRGTWLAVWVRSRSAGVTWLAAVTTAPAARPTLAVVATLSKNADDLGAV